MIRVVLIRHGRTALNDGTGMGERFRGILDLPLAEEGLAQARATARRLAGSPPAAIYASPLERARHTAEILAAGHGVPVQALPGLSSMNYGQWAGQRHSDVAQRWPEQYAAWRRDPFNVQIPGGESAAALRERALAAVHEALSRHSGGDTVWLVTHMAVTRLLACALLGLPPAAYFQVGQDLCNLSTYLYDPGRRQFSLESLNDTCHLDPALPLHRGPGVRLVVLRHGQTAWNPGAGAERFRGRTDLPLDGTGQAQAQAVAERLAQEPVAALLTSPLQRARQTVEPLAARLGLPIQAHAGLHDIDYGLWQGLTPEQAADAYPDLYRLWRTSPDRVRFPGGESLADVRDRLETLIGQLAETHPGQTLVLVGHQIVNKVLACHLLGLDLGQIWRIGQEPSALNLAVRQQGRWDVERLNDTCHLG